MEAGKDLQNLTTLRNKISIIGDENTSLNEFHATLLHLMGMDHRKLTFEHNGLEERLTGPSEVSVVEGLLA